MFYRISELARKAAITTRTLRYYDRMGLLSPSARSDGGYRLYTDDDLRRLQYLLALKFLGFTLEEIKLCVDGRPARLHDVLAQQKAMLLAKRQHLDRVIAAMTEAESRLAAGAAETDVIEQIAGVMQMERKPEEIEKYLTPEQRRQLGTLARGAYSPAALAKLRAHGWTAEDLRARQERYAQFRDGLRALIAAGADPAGPEAQAVAGLLSDLIKSASGGDPEVIAGMRTAWQSYMALPPEQRPPQYALAPAEQEFLRKAMVARAKGGGQSPSTS